MRKSSTAGRRPSESTARIAVTLRPQSVQLSDFATELGLWNHAGGMRPALVGRVEVERIKAGPRRVDVRGARVQIGGSDLRADVRMIFDGRPEVKAEVRCERLDLDGLSKAIEGRAEKKKKGRKRKISPGRFGGAGSEELAASVHLEAAAAVFQKRSFETVRVEVVHEGSKTSVRSASFDHAGGRFQGEAEVRSLPGTLSWRGTCRAEFPDVDTLVRSLGGSPQAFSGRLVVKADFRSAQDMGQGGKAKGTRAEGGVLGSFEADLTDGRLRTVRLATSALVPGLSRAFAGLLKNRIGWEERGIPFHGLHAEGSLAGTRVEVQRLHLHGPGIEIELRGSLALPGLAADLNGRATLWLPRLMRRIPRLAAPSRFVFPLRITGPITRPKISGGRPIAERDGAVFQDSWPRGQR